MLLDEKQQKVFFEFSNIADQKHAREALNK